ncbi:MAG: BON domain-containing protein, partial [Anaerolineae bacterium]|nr:BON domain-containing protein [Anaerolineae bacterium]
VAIALAMDPRTRLTTDRVAVTALLGSVMLTGVVDSADQKAAALGLARSVPGVWEVVDGLAVRQS